METLDFWLHAWHLGWVAKATGVCWIVNRRLDWLEANT